MSGQPAPLVLEAGRFLVECRLAVLHLSFNLRVRYGAVQSQACTQV